ncbi:MAG: hypothetical protein LBU22_03120 [Dysgonamonadaceae bacterium]|jgi:hypothetical protein|nr:hypothetical protein [Dysgonamonadaceae bacterium]
MATNKKVTRLNGGTPSTENVSRPAFVPTAESKGKATQLRIIAGILWFLAIVAEVGAIALLFKQPLLMVWIIVLIVVDLAFVIIGSMLWKKSNRLDPASEKDKFKFFMQNQLGLVAAIIAFLPLIVLILTNKNLDGKQKGILGGIAAVALIVAGLASYDFNPPSQEQYAEQTDRVEWLTGGNNDVYWTKSGKKYHIYDDCSSINTNKTDSIFEGSVAQARELKNITDLCKFCENRAIKERGLNEADYTKTTENTDDETLPENNLEIE